MNAIDPHAPASAAEPAGLRLDGIWKSFGQTPVLRDISLDLPGGQLSVLLGPSGCGKSTLLRLISGLEEPTAGTIRLGGEDITHRVPAQRNLSMVFQNYALFPHLPVAENILFGLSVRRVPKAEQQARLERVANLMGLETLLRRKPAQLSGGQQQRVALARAVVSERPVCLMDEPLSNLDAKLRAEMRVEIRALQQRLGLTLVYVTHDQVEAMTMADRIVVLNEGRIQQVASPRELYARPATTFCARFIGTPPMNLIPAESLPGHPVPPGAALIGVRPEDIAIAETGVPARTEGIEYLGADQLVSVRLDGVAVIVRQPARLGPPPETVRLRWPEAAQHLFDAAGDRLPDSPSNRFSHKERA
ncbi:ABC transporter ATP-binding protein [Rubellimicrobium sp. CFH 75288]|uniref:ABC transporter ATP-binding protein n=1 Tax=Rubellimicrobium sp. CFH 75288 TaxID=2697034 RepID=UPI001412DB1C|nr:ABC transporter ATP-binding protein [Rubellimicrobium sp. CFH 75288]NAZ36317.1 ATP-binding cassette domain-containing protein [Rubellimicrobium sp. CFH 75288]